MIDELCTRGRGQLLLRGDGAFSLGQRISKLGLKSHHIITSAPEYVLCNKRVVAGLGINLTAVFLVLSHNGASYGSSIFPATVCINLLEFGTGLMDRSSVDCPLIENAIRILIFSTVMPWRWHLGLSWLSAPMEPQLAATTLLRHCMERASPWLPLPTSVQPQLDGTCHPPIPTAQEEVGDQHNIHLPTR